MPRISLVIPAFNEERYLPLLLDSIESARQRCTAGPDEVEIVVADNASTDGTARLARLRGCRVVRVEKRAIAAARNGGARVATGRILGWKSVGGYDEGRLWAEDVAFMRALKRLGRARGQRFVRAKGACAVTSARKFDLHGDWHCFRYALRGPAWLLLNRPAVDRFVRSYWYDDRQ